MTYEITFQPLNRIAGVEPKTVTIETAAAAWLEVNGLMMSDERVRIRDHTGQEISWEQLRDCAPREAN